MIAKLLSGMQWCCCNNPPTYFGEKQEWYAVCLQCRRRVGPFRNATLAKKEWNKIMNKQYETWRAGE
jgi:hypothetical protein